MKKLVLLLGAAVFALRSFAPPQFVYHGAYRVDFYRLVAYWVGIAVVTAALWHVLPRKGQP